MNVQLNRADRLIPHYSAEICLNLWAFIDGTEYVCRLAGRAYALAGTEDEKLAALHRMACADHLLATNDVVPTCFSVCSEHGEIPGVIPAGEILRQWPLVFGPLINRIEADLPKGFQIILGKAKEFKMKIPKSPLFVMTTVFESHDGELIAQVKKS